VNKASNLEGKEVIRLWNNIYIQREKEEKEEEGERRRRKRKRERKK
jgi:hypothetical protein